MVSETCQINGFKAFSQEDLNTSIKDKCSNKLPITHGVPQGSIFGSLLFMHDTKDLNKAIVHS